MKHPEIDAPPSTPEALDGALAGWWEVYIENGEVARAAYGENLGKGQVIGIVRGPLVPTAGVDDMRGLAWRPAQGLAGRSSLAGPYGALAPTMATPPTWNASATMVGGAVWVPPTAETTWRTRLRLWWGRTWIWLRQPVRLPRPVRLRRPW